MMNCIDCIASMHPIMDKKEYCIQKDEQCVQQEQYESNDETYYASHVILVR